MGRLVIYFFLGTITFSGVPKQPLAKMLIAREASKIPFSAVSPPANLLLYEKKMQDTISRNKQELKPPVSPSSQIGKALRGKKIQLNAYKPAFRSQLDDSAYLLLPAAFINGQLPVSLKLRVITVGKVSSTFKDYQLIYDTLKNNLVLTRNSPDSANHITAGLNHENEELIITFPPPNFQVNSQVSDSLNSQISGKSPAVDNATANPAIIWYLLGIVLVLPGIFLLLWAVSRYLVFSVSIKPSEGPATRLDKNKNIELAEAALPRNERQENSNILQPPTPTQTLATSHDLPNENNPVTPNATPVIPYPELGGPAGRYFFSEVLITAGPRKKNMSDPDADKDLGEDVCGFLSDGRQLLLWLLDGTSDQYCLKNPENNREYFSSRLLAQSVAYQMRSAFNQVQRDSFFEKITQAIGQVKADWLQALAKLPVNEINILKSNIAGKNIPECATTLLFGHLSIAGELMAYRSGDCKMVFYTRQQNGQMKYTETDLARKKEASNDRLFFRLVLNEAGELDILYNQPKFELVRQDQVAALIAFSDGIGLETEHLLQQPPRKQLDEIRNLIIYQSQGTADDKSLCFVEIKEGYQEIAEQAI